MAQHHQITLSISAEHQQELLHSWNTIETHLEENLSPDAKNLDGLRELMRKTLDEQSGFSQICKDARVRPQIVHLSSDSPVFTNLPWHLSVVDESQLYIVKGHSNEKIPSTPAIAKPLPLKVLVMISSPENTTFDRRLDYEGEEDLILRAFEPLFNSGLVEIDFCEDGSLATLETKLRKNAYHILHFSGHGTFDPKEGTLLELEDPMTMERSEVTGNDFIKTLNINEAHRPSLVLLSSCLTAKGNKQEELQGLALDLIAGGVPATVGMSLSILDQYATQFAGKFYQALAEKLPIYQAFHEGLERIEEFEINAHPGVAPSQWMIPQLFTSPNLEHIVDWSSAGSTNKIKKDNRLLFGDFSLRNEQRTENYHFVGRRRDRKRALPVLTEGGSILLRGQGGIGKTALAEHLISRLLAARGGQLAVFYFNETTANLEHFQNELLIYLERETKNYNIRFDIEKEPEAFRRCIRLLAQVQQHQDSIVFVFDNLETLQLAPGEDFKPELESIAQLLTHLGRMSIPLLLTCRYQVKEVPEVNDFDLNTVSFNDYLKKCLQLSLRNLPHLLLKKHLSVSSLEAGNLSYRDVVQWLYDTFGGNYRALEFFDKLFAAGGNHQNDALRSLEDFRTNYHEAQREVLQQMSKNFLFRELLKTLSSTERSTLDLLAQFRISVLSLALDMQVENTEYAKILASLAQLTLIEVHSAPDSQLSYYYVAPLVRDLLREEKTKPIAFDHERAGRYYRYCEREVAPGMYNNLAEAWHHYLLADNKTEVNQIGATLTFHYYEQYQFQLTLYYGTQTMECCGVETDSVIYNELGLIYKLYGQLDQALHYFQLRLKDVEAQDYKEAIGITLSNIAQIYEIWGKYPQALKYLQESLENHQAIGNKKGQGTTLHNIGQIYYNLGEYEKAMDYLQRSLENHQAIGNKHGIGSAFSGIGQIYNIRGDYNQALKYLQKGLSYLRETSEKQGLGVTLSNIGHIYRIRGDYEKALEYLQESLVVLREIGDKKGEGMTLNNISQIYSIQGDYDQVIKYLQESLKIARGIDDKIGLAAALSNIGEIYNKRENYEEALKSFYNSLEIYQEIGNKQGEGVTLNNIGMAFYELGDHKKAREYRQKSLELLRDIGDLQGCSVILYNIGSIARENKDIKLAFQSFSEAWQIACQIKYSDGIFKSGVALATTIFFIKDDRTEPLMILRQSHELCRMANSNRTEELDTLIQQLINSKS